MNAHTMSKKITITLQGTMPNGSFALFESPTVGKTYICPGWIEVPYGTKREDIIVKGIPKPPPAKRAEYSVKGSTGSVYKVIIDTVNGNSCSCVGFTYRRACKHIDSVTKKSK